MVRIDRACPGALKWDIEVSCSGLDHGDASVFQGLWPDPSRKLQQQTEDTETGQVPM